MKLLAQIKLVAVIWCGIIMWPTIEARKMVCYYNTSRINDVNSAISDLEPALEHCDFLIYGYAGIDAQTYQLKTLDGKLKYDLYYAVTALKQRYKHLKVLLSVGGDRDHDHQSDNNHNDDRDKHDNKYLKLLEDLTHRNAFVNSAQQFVRTYGFDGLDLAWQFPKSQPTKQRKGLKKVWHTVKSFFKGDVIIDEKAEEHKAQFISLLRELRNGLSSVGSIMTMTVLPNVDPELFLNIPEIMTQIDFVTLAAFDFYTPERNPKLADYSASLYELPERDPTYNVDYHIQYWLNNTNEKSKLILGIPAYGRSWVMTQDSDITGYPPVPAGGPAEGGKQTQTTGLLSYPEICVKIHQNVDAKGDAAPLRKVNDITRRFGTYCYRVPDHNGQYGLWISYEEPSTAANKASYALSKGMGGAALFDLTMDDVHGECADDKYPILRSTKYKL